MGVQRPFGGGFDRNIDADLSRPVEGEAKRKGIALMHRLGQADQHDVQAARGKLDLSASSNFQAGDLVHGHHVIFHAMDMQRGAVGDIGREGAQAIGVRRTIDELQINDARFRGTDRGAGIGFEDLDTIGLRHLRDSEEGSKCQKKSCQELDEHSQAHEEAIL